MSYSDWINQQHGARAAVVGVAASSAVSWLMLSRTALDVQVGDGADFVGAAVTGGLAHPPGFPLYTTLATALVAVFDTAPYAALASVNAVLQSLAVGVLCALCCILSKRAWAGVAVGMVWALFPASLRSGTDVEVFALHHVLSLAVVAAGLVHLRQPTPICSMGLGLACGVAGAHQPISIFWAPFVLALLWHSSGTPRLRRLGFFAAGIVVGLSPYLLLWRRYAASPGTAFEDVTTWREWLAYVLREHYGTFRLGARTKTMQNGGAAIAWDAAKCAPGLFLGLFAVRRLIPPRLVLSGTKTSVDIAMPQPDWMSPIPTALAMAMLSHWTFATMLRIPAGSNHDVASRFAPSILLPTALCAAWCLGQATPRLRKVGVVVLLVPTLLQAPFALQLANARNDVRAAFVLDEALREAPPDAVWFAGTDTTIFGSTYRQTAQHVRPDVTTIFVPRLGSLSYRARLVERLPVLAKLTPEDWQNVGKVAATVYTAGHAVIADPLPVPEGFVRTPLGVVFQWSPSAPAVDEVRLRLLAMCTRFPEALSELPPAREATQWLWNAGFIVPIATAFTHLAVTDDPRGQALGLAAKALTAHDFSGARAACAAVPSR